MHLRRSPIVVFFSAAWLSGCAANARHANPSFPLDLDQAQALLDQMHDQAKPLARPVAVLSGYMDPGWESGKVANLIRQATDPQAKIINVSFIGVYTFDGCAERLIAAVDKAFPDHDPNQTTDVDVVAMSMGGLVARYAASPRFTDDTQSNPARRLNVRRLFTISTPHRGANLARMPAIDRRVIDMKPGSEFLSNLDQRPAAYELFTYVRLNDGIVGEENAAPPGQTAWWVPNPPLHFSHLGAGEDPRILADIARRLRGEQPLTTRPPTPLPERQFLALSS